MKIKILLISLLFVTNLFSADNETEFSLKKFWDDAGLIGSEKWWNPPKREAYFAADKFVSSKMQLKKQSGGFDCDMDMYQVRFWTPYPKQNDEDRVYIVLSGGGENKKIDTNEFGSFGIGYDRFFTIDKFKPFVGVNVGYAVLKINNINNVKVSSLERKNGISYGLQTGVMYIFNDSLDFEIGYKYNKSTASNTIIYNSQKEEIGVDSFSGAYLGISLKM